MAPLQRILVLLLLFFGVVHTQGDWSQGTWEHAGFDSWGGGEDGGTGSSCPRWEDNPECPCYDDGGVVLECPMVSLVAIANVLELIKETIKSLSIYDLDTNVTLLPNMIFDRSSGIKDLQISHSRITNIADNGFKGLEDTLESLTIKHCHLDAVPQLALQKLVSLKTLNIESNNITELSSFAFSRMMIKALNFKGNMINLISDFAFDGLEDSLEELNLINNDLKSLPIGAFQKLHKLKVLQVAWNQISEISSNGEMPLSTLESLDISNNNIKKLKSNSLAGMPNLRTVSLHLNHITNVAKDAFMLNPVIKDIFLGHNQIKELHPETFIYAEEIRTIDLNNNNLNSIDKGLFCNLLNLEELSLSNNNIRQVTYDTFLNTTSLRVLNLQNNAIRFIELGTFNDLEQLEELHLSHNSIVEIYPGLFTSNSALRVLTIDNNEINNLNEGIFKNTSQLHQINLQNNKVRKIERGLFSKCIHLKEIHLENNDIEFIAQGAFSNLKEIEFINLENNKIVAIPDCLSHTGNQLMTLKLSNNHINSIHNDALKKQSQLDMIWLNGNNITVVTKELFRDLTMARQLHLENNQINDIQNKAFHSMKFLMKLFLSNNFIRSIDHHMFDGLASLVELHLDNNMVKEIKHNAFKKLAKLETLDLSGNIITVLHKDIFNGDIPLRTLKIDDASIENIAEGTFESLINLEVLSLKGNNLQNLNGNFLKIPNLQNLNIAGNDFKDIDSKALTNLPNLESLDLSYCGVTSFPQTLFDECVYLRSMNIAGNEIKSLPSSIFRGLTDLRTLDISDNRILSDSLQSLLVIKNLEKVSLNGNPIERLSADLGRMSKLTEIQISNSNLRDIDYSTLLTLSNIEVLDLSGNNLTDLPLGGLKNAHIKKLNLANNQFREIPNGVFVDQISSLQELNISGNPLKRLMGKGTSKGNPITSLETLEASHTNLTVLTSMEMSLMPNLRRINFANSAINKISPGVFKNLSRLTHLNLGFNNLEILPRERLRGLTSLIYLNVTRNKLKKLDQLPSDAKSLKVLDASGNMLIQLEENLFRHSTNLEELLLTDNWITSIDVGSFSSLKKLMVLDLSHNNLEVLRPNIIEPVERSLDYLHLQGNPWNCTCDNMELWSWLQNHPSQVQQPQELRCYMPNKLRASSFLMLGSSSFCPQPLILRLAIQDIQSQSLLVSWQAANVSSIYGFKVTYQVANDGEKESSSGVSTGALHHHQSVSATPTLGLAARTFRLEELQPSTEYQVCVHGLAKSLTSHSHTITEDPENLSPKQNEGLRCSRGRTLSTPAAASTGASTSHIGIILGVVLAVCLVGGILGALLWYRMCRSKSDKHEKRPNGCPPDYYTTTQYTKSSRSYHQKQYYEEEEFAC